MRILTDMFFEMSIFMHILMSISRFFLIIFFDQFSVYLIVFDSFWWFRAQKSRNPIWRTTKTAVKNDDVISRHVMSSPFCGRSKLGLGTVSQIFFRCLAGTHRSEPDRRELGRWSFPPFSPQAALCPPILPTKEDVLMFLGIRQEKPFPHFPSVR